MSRRRLVWPVGGESRCAYPLNINIYENSLGYKRRKIKPVFAKDFGNVYAIATPFPIDEVEEPGCCGPDSTGAEGGGGWCMSAKPISASDPKAKWPIDHLQSAFANSN